MTTYDFLRSVRTARNVVLFNQVISPANDFTRLKRARELWLAPRVVAGYTPTDFNTLSTDNLATLTAAVDDLRAIATAAADREPTDDEVRQGLEHLSRIVAILEDEFLDTEGKPLLKAVSEELAKEPIPDFVLGLDYNLDTDWSGDPGIWLWAIIPDELDPESAEFLAFGNRFFRAGWPAMIRAKSNRLPYAHVRLLSEALGQVHEEVE